MRVTILARETGPNTAYNVVPPCAQTAAGGAPPTVAARAAKGSLWLVAARIGTRGIDLATLMLLARLLAPADFGVVAVAMVMVQIVEAVFDLPVSQVLVRAAAYPVPAGRRFLPRSSGDA